MRWSFTTDIRIQLLSLDPDASQSPHQARRCKTMRNIPWAEETAEDTRDAVDPNPAAELTRHQMCLTIIRTVRMETKRAGCKRNTWDSARLCTKSGRSTGHPADAPAAGGAREAGRHGTRARRRWPRPDCGRCRRTRTGADPPKPWGRVGQTLTQRGRGRGRGPRQARRASYRAASRRKRGMQGTGQDRFGPATTPAPHRCGRRPPSAPGWVARAAGTAALAGPRPSGI